MRATAYRNPWYSLSEPTLYSHTTCQCTVDRTARRQRGERRVSGDRVRDSRVLESPCGCAESRGTFTIVNSIPATHSIRSLAGRSGCLDVRSRHIILSVFAVMTRGCRRLAFKRPLASCHADLIRITALLLLRHEPRIPLAVGGESDRAVGRRVDLRDGLHGLGVDHHQTAPPTPAVKECKHDDAVVLFARW
jgi:hypothetical protein